jgi:hypothetical protein
MSECFYHLTSPNIISTNVEISEDIQRRMIQCVLDQKDLEITKYHGGYTFEVLDPFGDFSRLYNVFLDTVQRIFGPLELSTKHKHWCWANVYNCETFRTNLHDHLATSTINGIFYLSIPNDCLDGEAGVSFLVEDEETVYLPDELELIIMPNYQKHAPQPHSSQKNRIAINMEICIIDPVEAIYNTAKIYTNCTPQKN